MREQQTHQATAHEVNLSQVSSTGIARGFELISTFADRFNQSCADNQKLDPQELIQKLKTAGAVNDELLLQLSAKEIEETVGVPPVVARGILNELKTLSGTVTAERPETIPSRLRVQMFSLKQLVKDYDPNEVGGNVTAELKTRVMNEIGRNPRVIVLKQDGSVDTEVSYKLLEEALQGDPDLEQAESNGRITYTFRIGERPDRVVDLHPLSGEPLRANGLDADGYNWLAVPLPARQLLHLAVESGEIQEDISPLQLEEIVQRASSESGVASLGRVLKKAAREFDRLSQIGGLPPLKDFRISAEQNPDRIFKL